MSEDVLLLLVDDHEANLLSLESILEGPGIGMIKALSANEALRLMLKHDFALALIDVQMPGMNGFEMAELMRANPRTRNIPIIFVTGMMNDVHLQFQGYELGAVDYLVKPFVPHVLRNKVNVFCELFRQNRRLVAANAELIRARDIAETATRAKSEFLANMSHEIRTPLNSVIGMAHLALRSGLDQRQSDYVQKIVFSGQHLLELINDVLDISKIEAGMLDLEVTDFDLAAVIANLRNLLEARAATKFLALDFSIDPAIPSSLRGDPLRLGQVMINLVSNGIKFTERGGISVRATLSERAGDEAVLRFEITDTGIGIPLERIGGLFQVFQQLDSSTTRKFGGTGLGLAICKQLVEKMGGKIGVNSTPGLGSTFWFTVQLGAQLGVVQPIPVVPPIGTALATALHGVRILLVEDHPFNQQIASEMLEDVGAIVCIANNGNEALNWLQREHFDCVLMDMQMPEMDGLEATRRIRTDPALANLRIIAMTANASRDDRERCMAAGMDDFMTKPVLPDSLYAIVAKWGTPATPQDTPVEPRQAVDSTDCPAGDPQIIDLSILALMVRNDRQKVRRFAEKFIESTSQGIAEIEAAQAKQDIAALAALGHRLKSSARSVGAIGFADLCQQLQETRNLGSAGKIVAQLRPLLQRITQAVSQFNKQTDATADQ